MCAIKDIVAEVRPWEDYIVDENGRLVEPVLEHNVDKNDIIGYRCDAHEELTTFYSWKDVKLHMEANKS